MKRAGVSPWLTALALALGALGCESLRGGANPEVPVWVHRPSWALDIAYTRNLLAQSRKQGEPYERGGVEIDSSGRRVFVGSSDNGLYALRAEDGEALWRFETLGAVQCEPLYDSLENVVYFGSNDGALYKVGADRGTLIWRFSTNAEVARRPILAGNTLYAVNANDTILALDKNTGERRWSQHRTPALAMEVAGYAGALAWLGRLYVAFSDGTVTAYDGQTGNEIWQPIDLSAEAEQRLGQIPRYLDVDTTPVAGQVEGSPVVYVGGYEGGVFALDAETGNIVWSNPAVLGVTDVSIWEQPAHDTETGSLSPARRLLIASTGTTGLWALDPETGTEVWRRDLPDGGISKPVSILGALLISTTRQGLFLVSPLDGGIIDGIHNGLGFSMPATAYGRRAFILSNGGQFLSLYVRPPS
jgi:outer membrane protein assembly factor BamB